MSSAWVQRGWNGQPLGTRPRIRRVAAGGPQVLGGGHHRIRPHQRGRIRMRRLAQHPPRGAVLHGLAGIHDHTVLGQPRRIRQVVGHGDQPEAALVAQLAQPAHQRLLGARVQPGGGLVQHHQRRIQGQHHRQQRPPPLPARELMRIAVQQGRVQADLAGDLLRPRPALPPTQIQMGLEGLGDLRPHRGHRVERRLLQPHRHRGPPQPPPRRLVGAQQLRAVHPHAAPCLRRLHQPRQALRQRGLARPALAHHRQRLATPQRQIQPAQCRCPVGVADFQVSNEQQWAQ
jgi:hypothetical protein